MSFVLNNYVWNEIAGLDKRKDLSNDWISLDPNHVFETRIGSRSSGGQVFEYNGEYAVKILPGETDNSNEVTIAQDLAQKSRDHFPSVYGLGTSNDTLYLENDDMRLQQIEDHIKSTLNSKSIRKLDKNPELYELLYKDKPFPLPCTYLVMEMAWGDMKQLAMLEEKEIVVTKTSEWLDLATQVVEGILIMNSMGIEHCDMKLANILITFEGDKTKALIADFGNSRRHKKDKVVDISFDLIDFFDSLADVKKLEEICDKAIETIENSKDTPSTELCVAIIELINNHK